MASKLTPAREIAYSAFIDVMEHGANPDETLDKYFSSQLPPLKRIDRNLAKEILYGSLRWYSKIIWIVQHTASRDLKKSSPEVRAGLILGTYQIFYMSRVPDRAAVNESVEFVRSRGQAHAVKFINGILRTIARRSEYFTKPDKDKRPTDYLALQFSHPKWLVERWSQRFSFERLKDLLSENNRTPPYSVRINSIKVNSQDLQDFRTKLLKQDKNHSERRSIRSCLHLKNSPNFSEGGLFQDGFYSVQDEASQLIGYLVAPREGERVLDACCGPGGKIGHIYELGQGKIDLYGVEQNPEPMRRAQENFKRLGHTERISWVQEDFLEYQSEEKFDRILLDSPCSGLGVLRRHPEGKWQKKITIVSKMAKQQKVFITHALSLLKPGGELIYSVCSFEPEESVGHLEWLSSEFKDKIERVSPLERLPDYYKRFVTRELALLIYSGNKDMMDGFGAFIVKKL